MDGCIKKFKTKFKLRDNDLNDWEDFVKRDVAKGMKNLRRNSNVHYHFQKQFVIKLIDKTAKKVSSTCNHCVRSVRIRNYSGLHFPAFGLNVE